MFEKEITKIKRSAQVGLWGSVAAVIASAVFFYASPWQFRQSEQVSRWMLVTGAVLAVLTVSMSLLVIRRQVPALRKQESLEAKLQGYASHISSLYLTVLAVVVMVCLMMILSAQNVLLMLAIVATLMLFLAYPNIYKMKVDLGLTDGEMKMLFGDRYIADSKDEE